MRIGLGAPTALLAAVLLLTIAPEALAVPGNDDLADASDVTALPFVDDVDPVDATVEPGEPPAAPRRTSTPFGTSSRRASPA